MTATIEQLQTLLDERFGGVLETGKHDPDGKCCILELASQAMGINWTDDHVKLRCVDIRALNDAPWSSDKLRTKHLPLVYVTWQGSLDWPVERLQRCVTALAIGTVNRLIAELPGLPTDITDKCRCAKTLTEASAASRTASRAASAASQAASAASQATYAANWAAKAASWAAEAASWAASAATQAAAAADAADRVLIAACDMWVEAGAVQ